MEGSAEGWACHHPGFRDDRLGPAGVPGGGGSAGDVSSLPLGSEGAVNEEDRWSPGMMAAVALAIVLIAAFAWYQARQILGDQLASCEQSQEDN